MGAGAGCLEELPFELEKDPEVHFLGRWRSIWKGTGVGGCPAQHIWGQLRGGS